MRLTREGIADREAWTASGYLLPGYDIEKVRKNGRSFPRWVHFGTGNIFRVFLARIADELLEAGLSDSGVVCVETFDPEIVDRIYRPFDDLILSVILRSDGKKEKRVLASIAESVNADAADPAQWARLRDIFANPSLQMVSFTITEKGYALKNESGEYTPSAASDIAKGPNAPITAVGILTSMLYERFRAGKYPVALVSMDNCAHNGDLLKNAVADIAGKWRVKGFVDAGFTDYLYDKSRVAFPYTMIDKITPRPSDRIAQELANDGVEDMDPLITSKRTYIAPFVNAEKPQYLVIEDAFPNGRPALERGSGVYLTDRGTVEKAERMKVTACLNPVHSATGPLGVVLGIELFSDVMRDEDLSVIARAVAYKEGLPVAPDPGIISPKAFTDELFLDRFPNPYLGDANLRLCTDVSQGVGVRFGETVKAYAEKYGSAERLTAIPLGIAGWLRYMLAVDDSGKPYELAPDPMNETIGELMKDVVVGDPSSLKTQLRPLLSNGEVFHTDLYAAGIGEKIESILGEMIAGPGSVRKTVGKYREKLAL